jgi:hypothetical protein
MKTNNKLREALATLVDVVDAWKDHLPSAIREGELSKAIEKAEDALAEPVRNYEVGTVEEQYSRMFRECYEWMCMDCKQNKDLRKCALSWAQKPYVEKEGDAK